MIDPLDRPDSIIADVTNVANYLEAHLRNSPNMPIRMVFEDGLTVEGIPQRLTRGDGMTLVYLNVKGKLMIFNVDNITELTLRPF